MTHPLPPLSWMHTPAQATAGPQAATEPDRRWDFLLVCLAAYVLTAVGRIHQLFAWLEPLHLTLLFAGLALVLYAADGKRTRRLHPVLRDRTTRCVLALLLWTALSIPGALWPGGAFTELTDEFGKAAIMYVVLAGALRGFRDVERIAFTYMLAVGIYAAVVLSRYGVGESQWRLASLVYYDANDFATLAVIALPLAVYFMVRPGPAWRRLTSVVAAVSLVIAFVWAGSRGGFLALLAIGVFLLLRYRAVHPGWRVLATALIVVVFCATATDTFWDKMKTILHPKDDYNFTTEEGRVEVWKRGISYMLQRPVFGVGAGNFPTAEGTISPAARETARRGVKWSVAHNSYVQTGAELGIPGLIFFLLLLMTAFRSLRAVQRARLPLQPGERGPPQAQLAQVLTAALIGFAVGAFFLSLADRDLLYVLLALCAALRRVSSPLVLAQGAPLRASPWQR